MVKSVTTQPLISVVVRAHNEEEYVDKCLLSLSNASHDISSEMIFIADRCTDKTVERAKKYNVKIVDKTWRKWKNSHAEAFQTGYLNAKGVYIGIVDVDMVIPSDFFKELLPMIKDDIASVAAEVITYPDTLLNRLRYAWEKTYSVAPLGRGPCGGARVVLRKALDEINGFRDIPAPDTDVDIRLASKGYKSVVTSIVRVYHVRHMSLRKIVDGQIESGRGRYALGLGLMRTLGHALFRFRPFVVCGWLLERRRRLRYLKE
jgi:glycosyltransferase involved in cell wall biosynthesis